jgi:hypothetical protein
MRRALTICLLLLACLAPGARASLVARGDLFVDFKGGIAPKALPRHSLAPITVWLRSTIGTLSGDSPPALRRMVIRLNRAGHLDTQGLATCTAERVKATSTRTALRACAPALVGEGSFRSATAFPEQSSFPSSGHILAFNSRSHGHPAILAHVYGVDPVAATRLIVFGLREEGGSTILTGTLPAPANRHGYLTYISLVLHRNFRFQGQRHTYLSAACAAPPGFSSALFTFAHAAMSFAGARTLSSALVRTCKVKE